MSVHLLERRQFIPKPLEEVFAFFEKPENLAKITPPSLGFEILNPPPIRMRQGLVIDYIVRPLLFPMRWTSLIREYEPPLRFVDVQSRGPYRSWRHIHSFREEGNGTWVEDEVRYEMPLGWVGEFAHAAFVRRQLEGIFDYRSKVILRELQGS